jgi:subtilisin-like proprotein convertase family protein
VRSILQNTADKKVGSVPSPVKTEDPHFQSDFNSGDAANGYSRTFGYGILNPLQALLVAQEQIRRFESPARWIEQRTTSPMDIPDGDRQGLLSDIQIEEDHAVLQVEVSVEIEHSFMSDLEIYLIAPNANPILLQPRTTGRVNVLRKTYTPGTTPSLQTLRNQSTQGNWQLQVIDRVPSHTGALKGWGLRLGVAEASH